MEIVWVNVDHLVIAKKVKFMTVCVFPENKTMKKQVAGPAFGARSGVRKNITHRKQHENKN